MKKKIISIFLIVLLTLSLMPLSAFAASASVRASSSSVNVGDTVSVTVTFSGNKILGAEATYSYNSNILKYVSGDGFNSDGKISVYSSSGQSSISTTITFKAVGSGTTNISVSASEIYDANLSSLGGASGSTKVTVKSSSSNNSGGSGSSGGGSGSSGGSSSTKKPSNTEPTPSPTPSSAISVDVDGNNMTIIGNLDEIELPSGSEQKTIDYDGQEISAATKFGLDLVYLTDENGENGAFYIYSEGKFMPYVEIDQTGTYTILPLPDSEELPQGLIASQLTIDNTSVQGWIDAESNYIVYAVDDEGNKGFYTYNFSEGRLIKYIPSTSAAASPEPSSEAEPTSSAEGSSVEVNADVDSKPKSMLEKLTSDMMFTAAVGGLAILIVVMLIVFICIVSNKKTPDDIEAGKHGRD